jgi:hypothetical protein
MTATKIFISYAHDDAEIAIRIVEAIRTTGHQVWIDIEQIAWGQSFLSRMAEGVAAVPVEQVVGSSIATKYESQGGKPVLMREPKVFFIDDKDGKAIGINLFIGKRPYAAFGNSGGDREMLEWAGAGDGARLKMLVLHDDAEREY